MAFLTAQRYLVGNTTFHLPLGIHGLDTNERPRYKRSLAHGAAQAKKGLSLTVPVVTVLTQFDHSAICHRQ